MRLFRLLLIACVLVCGAHVAEPVQAHDEAAHHAFEAGPGHAGDEPADAHENGAAHAVQHHCPFAPDQAPAAVARALDPCGLEHFAAPAVALASLTRAPPLEPPAA